MVDFSFQLYSARNFVPLASLFPKLKALGYAHVEGYGGLYGDARDLASALKASGLSMPTGHFGLDQLEDIPATLKIAEQLGIKTLVCPFVPPAQRSPDKAGWVALAQTLNRLCAAYAKEGLKFGWHNHDFEFLPLKSGEYPLDLLLEGAPETVWQADIAWIVRAGEDPAEWIERYGNRIASVHVKDIAPQGQNLDEDGWADVGEGVLDWQALFFAIRQHSSCTSFVMEHDNPGDVERFASRSIAAANRLWS
ncbi:MAG TPA: sugar phosphate isomerase/epimerase [Devosia sp.]|nr:sugar phosphate isomerase/epimerase [Devosia sp.]